MTSNGSANRPAMATTTTTTAVTRTPQTPISPPNNATPNTRSAVTTTTTTTTPAAANNNNNNNNVYHSNNINLDRQQGVLWKRRDVFKNQWRPRWFVLQPRQGCMTYYLLTAAPPVDGTRLSSQSQQQSSPLTGFPNNHAATTPTGGTSSLRNRTASWDSQVSENTLDYDVVPRGTIYLLGGCTVTVNDKLTKERENMFAFTITMSASNNNNSNNNDQVAVHLAARTAAARKTWMEKIARVCQRSESALHTPLPPPRSIVHNNNNNNNNNTAMNQGGQPLVGTSLFSQGTIPEHIVEEVTDEEDASSSIPSSSQQQQQQQQQQHSNSATAAQSPSRSNRLLAWTPLAGEADSVYARVPDALVKQIQKKIQRYFPLMDDNDTIGPSVGEWKTIFQDETHAAYRLSRSHTATNAGKLPPPLIKSVALLDHPPLQVLNLILDVTRRREFETNVKSAQRLHVYNPHVCLDRYAYTAVWPTSSRDFAVALHWQVVTAQRAQTPSSSSQGEATSGDEKALLVLSFSCPEAEALAAVAPDHVRAKLFVSMYLLRPVGNSSNQCHLTRILSLDPRGGVTRHMTKLVVQQQAGLPAVIAEHLQRKEPVPENRFCLPLSTNQAVIDAVVQRLGHVGQQQQVQFSPTMSPLSSPGAKAARSAQNGHSAARDTIEIDYSERSSGEKPTTVENVLPSLDVQAALLLAPLVLYRALRLLDVPGVALLFCLASFFAIRQLVLLHLGDAVPRDLSPEPNIIGSITCRFDVDLKGVLRFVTNKKEEREELHIGSTEISVVHLLCIAVARALKQEPLLRQRRVRIPWLGIDEYYDTCSEPVNVSVSENAGGIVTLKNVDSRSVQDVADEMAKADRIHDETKEIGQCLVLATPNYDQSDMEIDVVSVHPDVVVVAVIGGVRLERNDKHNRGISRGPHVGAVAPPRPVLSLSLTITGPQQTDIITCRRYADEVQKLLQFPEICDS